MSMLHESEEDGVEGILSVYDTPFGLSTYPAVEAASYDIRLRSTVKDELPRSRCFQIMSVDYSCYVVIVPIHYRDQDVFR